MFELVDRAAVERGRSDDVVAGLEQREERGRLRGDAARERNRTASLLEVRHPLFEHRHRRIHDAGVGVAVFLQVEVSRRRFRILKHVARRLINRYRAGTGIRIRALPCVHLARLKSEFASVFGSVNGFHLFKSVRGNS